MEEVSKIIDQELAQYFDAALVPTLFAEHDENQDGYLDKGEMA